MDAYLKHRVENITEEDFWSAIRPSPELTPALEAAKRGKRARAYLLLGKYHAESLAAEASVLEEEVAETYQNDTKKRADLRRRAGMVLRHEIQGWDQKVIKFGPKIDFNADFGRSGQYGFHYLSWLTPLLHAFVLTGEEKYRDCLIDILGQHYAQRNKLAWRIPHLHPVYYELGARAKVLLVVPAYAVLAGQKGMKAGNHEGMLKLLLGCARSLYRLQGTGYRAGNWQIVGAMALFQMGCAFPEFKEAAQWRRRARKIALLHAKKDFYADGCHGERCWGYGWMSLNGMLRFYRTGLRHNRLGEAKAPMTRLLKKGFRWFAATVSPTLHLLNYGDGGITSAEMIFAEARKTFPKIDHGPGLLGVDRSKSCILRPSGYAFMRHGDTPESPYMSINFGHWPGGHTHADLLDFSLWRYGEPLIDEVGRFGSYDNPMDTFFRSETAHNQIVIEHRTMNRREHRGRDVVWHSADRADFFSAYHDGYSDVYDARIRRQIVFVKPDYWVIYDVVTARENIFQVSSYLHSPRAFKVLGKGVARVSGSKSCLVAFADPAGIRRFRTAVDYGKEEYTAAGGNAPERHRLVATTWRDIGDPRPIRFAMLLMPFKGTKTPPASIKLFNAKAESMGLAEAFSVTMGSRRDVIVFNPGRMAGVKVGSKNIRGPMAARIKGKWIECPDNGRAR